MYNNFFRLNDFPFSITSNPEFFCEAQSHREALSVIEYCLSMGNSFIKVIGEVGVGKTLICKKIMELLRRDFYFVHISNPDLTPNDFRGAVARELGCTNFTVSDQHEILGLIRTQLEDMFHQKKRVVLIVDEAQAMSDQTLEALRLLTNFEKKESKLMQVVLFGQPELDIRLSKSYFRQLNDRITESYQLKPLMSNEISAYLNRRLIVAGHHHGAIFTKDAQKSLERVTNGIPRLMNLVAHKAMMSAYSHSDKMVKKKHINEALKELPFLRERHKNSKLFLLDIAIILSILALFFYIF